MNWRLGTMGWSYSDWVDSFYPRELEQGRWIEFYSRHFNTVEIDSTFYAVPTTDRMKRWAARVPSDFRFTLKTPRLITHDLPLDRAVEPMRAFVKVARELGDRLGIVLLQFPPMFAATHRRDLTLLLDSLPPDLSFAVEFRHASWFTESTRDLLRARNLIWTAGDYDEQPLPMWITSDQLYIRWIGTHNRFPSHMHEQQDRSNRLRWWQQRLTRAAEHVHTVWGMFNNDFTGNSIQTCNRFKQSIGKEIKTTLGEQQGRLF